MRMVLRTHDTTATGLPRLRVRHGAAGLLAEESLLILAWVLLWAAFLLAVAHPVLPAFIDDPGAGPAVQAGSGAVPSTSVRPRA